MVRAHQRTSPTLVLRLGCRPRCRSGGGGMIERGKLPAGAAQGRHGKSQRIEPLIIPQLGEVKTNRGRLAVLVLLDALEEPGEAACRRGSGRVQGSGFGV